MLPVAYMCTKPLYPFVAIIKIVEKQIHPSPKAVLHDTCCHFLAVVAVAVDVVAFVFVFVGIYTCFFYWLPLPSAVNLSFVVDVSTVTLSVSPL